MPGDSSGPSDDTSTPSSRERRATGRKGWSSGLRSGFIALSYRNYRLFWLGQLVSVTGTWMQSLAQSWLVYEILGATPFQLGMVNVLQFLPVLLFGIPAGILADRFPKRTLLMLTQLGMMVTAIVMTTIVMTDIVELWHVYVIASIFGVARAVDMPTRQAFVSEVVPRDALMNAIALNSALFNTGRIVGPAVAGVLLTIVGPGLLFAIDAFSYLAVLTGLLMMRVAPIANPSTDSPLQRLREGIAYVRADATIFRTVIMVGTIGIFGMNFNVWVPVLASDHFSAGSSAYGTLFSAMGAGSLIGALSLAFIGRGPNRTRMIAAVAIMGVAEIALALIAGSTNALLLGAFVLALVGFSNTNAMSTANTTVQTAAEDHIRGRVMAVYMTVFAGSIPIGALMAGWVTGHFGAPISVAAGGTMVLVVALVQIWAARHPRQAPRTSRSATARAES